MNALWHKGKQQNGTKVAFPGFAEEKSRHEGIDILLKGEDEIPCSKIIFLLSQRVKKKNPGFFIESLSLA